MTLVLYPLAAQNEVTATGHVIALGRHYTGRRSIQIVFSPLGNATPMIIGLGMVKDFRAGGRYGEQTPVEPWKETEL